MDPQRAHKDTEPRVQRGDTCPSQPLFLPFPFLCCFLPSCSHVHALCIDKAHTTLVVPPVWHCPTQLPAETQCAQQTEQSAAPRGTGAEDTRSGPSSPLFKFPSIKPGQLWIPHLCSVAATWCHAQPQNAQPQNKPGGAQLQLTVTAVLSCYGDFSSSRCPEESSAHAVMGAGWGLLLGPMGWAAPGGRAWAQLCFLRGFYAGAEFFASPIAKGIPVRCPRLLFSFGFCTCAASTPLKWDAGVQDEAVPSLPSVCCTHRAAGWGGG